MASGRRAKLPTDQGLGEPLSHRQHPHQPGQGPRQPQPAVIPRATYRIQLSPEFGFREAAALIPYLATLGISHCYCSPYFQARPGSTHGYDVVAHHRLNPELGNQADFDHFCQTLAQQGMGQLLDMVPNHVGVMGQENPWWQDLLENGQASDYAEYFDIDWAPLREELRGKILIPVLGDHYGNLLDQGALRLDFDPGRFHIQYHEHRFPIDPQTYPDILEVGLERLRERLAERSSLAEFESLIGAFAKLPSRNDLNPEALIERRRDAPLHQQRLAQLADQDPDIGMHIQDCLRAFNGNGSLPPNPERLHALLEHQAYRLAHWLVAGDEINYRRFFDINDLAALRMEYPRAFADTHALALDLYAQGKIDGLRIDHPDGLMDPGGYFRNLSEAAIQARASVLSAGSAVPAIPSPFDPQGQPEPRLTSASNGASPPYLIAEKILIGDEALPADWPIQGTTGYDFSALVDRLLVDPDGETPLLNCWEAFAGSQPSLADSLFAAKRQIMDDLLASELHVLSSEFARIAETDTHSRDFTQAALREALATLIACFPVYRGYMGSQEPTTPDPSTQDLNQLRIALAAARRRRRLADPSVFGFIERVLLNDFAEGKPDTLRARIQRLRLRFQQYCAPVAAKGMEDTAWYRWIRLISLNEVGGDPGCFAIPIARFHASNQRRLQTWAHGLLAGSTHDNKRSEDLRARLHVLSELPEQWRHQVHHWSRLNRRFVRTLADGRPVPDPNTQYLFYQTLLGVWPVMPVESPEAQAELATRVRAYMIKAVKEAKEQTAWINADTQYEKALDRFLSEVLDVEHNPAFFAHFLPWQRQIARLGLYNSLSQTLLRFTAPGVPDLYQGNELWRFDLVDPDNRRPVDFAQSARLLARIRADFSRNPGTCVQSLVRHLEDGRAKLHLIHRCLALRKRHPALFREGTYRPLDIQGPLAEHLCAFARIHQGQLLISIAPRLLARLAPPLSTGPQSAEEQQPNSTAAGISLPNPFQHPSWKETRILLDAALEDQDVLALQHILTGEPVQIDDANNGETSPHLNAAAVLDGFPVALLSARVRPRPLSHPLPEVPHDR